MNNYALIFSGQGSERVGMFKDLSKEPNWRGTVNNIEAHLGIDIGRLISSGNLEVIANDNQVLLLLYHYLVSRPVIEKIGHAPALCMGHSLGQFSALVCSNAVSFIEMMDFIKKRSEVIHSPNIESNASLVSLHGISLDAFLRFQKIEALSGDVELALHNQEEQVVVAATKRGYEKLRALSSKYRFIQREANVSRPYHTCFMEAYNQALIPCVDALAFTTAECPVLMNYSKQPVSSEKLFYEETKIQMVKPVYWYESIVLAAEMVDTLVIVDPSETQLKITRKITTKKIHAIRNMSMVRRL
jgi:[acyl-carrier-protein] S-malonyltransferase